MSITKPKQKTAKEVAAEITSKRAHEFLVKERTERAQAAKKELDAVLEKYNCELVGVPIYSATPDGRFITAARVDLIPK